jgi:hypothetical protein
MKMKNDALLISVSPEVFRQIGEQISPEDRFVDTELLSRNFWFYSARGRPVYFIVQPIHKLEHHVVTT